MGSLQAFLVLSQYKGPLAPHRELAYFTTPALFRELLWVQGSALWPAFVKSLFGLAGYLATWRLTNSPSLHLSTDPIHKILRIVKKESDFLQIYQSRDSNLSYTPLVVPFYE